MASKVGIDEVSSQILSGDVVQAVNRNVEGRVEYSGRIEDPKELESRLRREEAAADSQHRLTQAAADSQHRVMEANARAERILRLALNMMLILALFVVTGFCSYILYGSYTLDEKELVQPIVTGAIGTMAGYVSGKVSK